MTELKHFLTRWSRKKLKAVEPSERVTKSTDTASEIAPPQGEGADKRFDERALDAAGKQTTAGPSAAQPIFDAATLPSLESIGAQTDVRPFLRSGVPPELTRAALRRAWSADPAIRDFKGLAESDWDFNDPSGMHGFGELGPEFDVEKMVAALFGETSKDDFGTSGAKTIGSDGRTIPVSGKSADVSEGQLSDAAPSQNAGDTSQPPKQDGVAIPPTAFRPSDAKRQDNFSVTKKNKISKEQVMRPRSRGGALPQS
jgi:hypothetical protein